MWAIYKVSIQPLFKLLIATRNKTKATTRSSTICQRLTVEDRYV